MNHVERVQKSLGRLIKSIDSKNEFIDFQTDGRKEEPACGYRTYHQIVEGFNDNIAYFAEMLVGELNDSLAEILAEV